MNKYEECKTILVDMNRITTMMYKIVDNFISKELCQSLIDQSEAHGYNEADISYASGSKMNKDLRNNLRCNLKDESLRLDLEKLILEHCPKKHRFEHRLGGIVEKDLIGLSGNIRFYKYVPGQEFKKHRDQSLNEEGGISQITVLIYLNDVPDEAGGETNLCDRALVEPLLVKPEAGKLLMFDHSLMHSGEVLKEGVKYVLRTDLIYSI